MRSRDDTIIWISHAMKDAGADIDVLLQGNSVNYGILEQDAGGLAIGNNHQTRPPDILGDIESLLDKGCKIYVVKEDIVALGIKDSELLNGLEPIAFADVAACMNEYDQVWHW